MAADHEPQDRSLQRRGEKMVNYINFLLSDWKMSVTVAVLKHKGENQSSFSKSSTKIRLVSSITAAANTKILHVLERNDFRQCGLEKFACDVYLSQNGDVPPSKDVNVFRTNGLLEYEPFCDDFGPMNMLCITKFIEMLDNQIQDAISCNSSLVYCSAKGQRNVTNSAFLLGAYMILKLEMHPHAVQGRFDALDKSCVEGYRDATFAPVSFRLQLIDCWKGLHQGKRMDWVAMPSRDNPTLWGQIDIVEHRRYAEYCNGDLHIVVPDKFVAFRGPKVLPGNLKYKDNFKDGQFSSRDFSPAYYSDIFDYIGVKTVVRLNEIHYPASQFQQNDIAHHDLFFEDCTPPPSDIVAKFFDIADGVDGLIAIHCKAGLGRTGTLIALVLMRSYGFTAREAMGWLRIMRPGSVIGEQQAFLCSVEEILRENMTAADSDVSAHPSRQETGPGLLPALRRRATSVSNLTSTSMPGGASPSDGAAAEAVADGGRISLPAAAAPPRHGDAGVVRRTAAIRTLAPLVPLRTGRSPSPAPDGGAAAAGAEADERLRRGSTATSFSNDSLVAAVDPSPAQGIDGAAAASDCLPPVQARAAAAGENYDGAGTAAAPRRPSRLGSSLRKFSATDLAGGAGWDLSDRFNLNLSSKSPSPAAAARGGGMQVLML